MSAYVMLVQQLINISHIIFLGLDSETHWAQPFCFSITLTDSKRIDSVKVSTPKLNGLHSHNEGSIKKEIQVLAILRNM